MPESKKACVIYVTATEGEVPDVRDRLLAAGYDVREVKADLQDAIAAQSGATSVPKQLADCIGEADLCIFLLPELEQQDGCIGPAAGLAELQGKQIVGVVCGGRETYPEELDDNAESMVRARSPNLPEAIAGECIWEDATGKPVTDRKIKHVRCQT